MNRSAAFAVAIPGCLLAAASLVALMLAAAGVREEAEAARLMEQGQDPNASYPIRPGILFERPAKLTPLEAAVINDDPAIVALLFANGAAVDGPSWLTLRCFAGNSRVSSVLDAHRPAAVSLECAGQKTPWD